MIPLECPFSSHRIKTTYYTPISLILPHCFPVDFFCKSSLYKYLSLCHYEKKNQTENRVEMIQKS